MAPFVLLADRWRDSLGLSHQRFVEMLGREKTEWSHYRSGRRARPSAPFVRAVLARADEPWRSAFERAVEADALARVAPGADTAA